MAVDPALLQSLEWRNIGPHRGGRVVAVAADPVEQMTFYFGACAGGVWKTTDGGTYWENVSDGFFNTLSVGAIAVAPSDPNVIYAGTGESCIRNDVVHGDGVYRSTDGGRTWSHLGLEDTRHISRIRVHPGDPDTVYVAALGHAFGPNDERGVFRSKDGGATWERVLFKSERAGACDLSLDPNNPRILYAALWQAQRSPWTMDSGGPDSGLYRSTDGGDSWTDISRNPGLPDGLLGRIGVAISPAKDGRVWTHIEATDDKGGLYRSDDAGATWERTSDDGNLIGRPWYYMHVFADPQDPETVYVLNVAAWKSTDAGSTFTQLTTPHGDNHDLWIDPHNPRRMIEGNDGGACVSFNGGETWSTVYNQPTACFWRMTVDNQVPYRVYGTQQDNSAISVPSRTNRAAIVWSDCYPVASSESGFIAVNPDDPNIVFSGATGSAPGGGGPLYKYDHRTRQTQLVTVWPEYMFGRDPKDLIHRFPWTFPIAFSPHDSRVLYSTGECAFRSTDEGQSWEPISPDLTRNDPDRLVAAGGEITKDTSGAEVYCTLSCFVESPHEAGVFWVGSDDGLIHISRDGGSNWSEVTPGDMPEWSYIHCIEVSPHDPAGAYVAVNRSRLDDDSPRLYRTEDYGQSWQRIDGDLPDQASTRVIRADPAREGLLYVGTDGGVYVSFDDGDAWQPLQLNLPPVPVYDMQVKENDLVAGTHGRAFWILDDLTPLHQISDEVERASTHLFTPRPSFRMGVGGRMAPPVPPGAKVYAVGLGAPAAFYSRKSADGEMERVRLDCGENLPDGVLMTYHFADEPDGEVKLTVLDESGEEIRSFTNAEPKEEEEGPARAEPRVKSKAGSNRFVWDMRYAAPRAVAGQAERMPPVGPLAPPGSYQVRLDANGESRTAVFEIRRDPRIAATQEDLDAQFELLIQIRDKLSETNDAVNRIRNISRQLDEWLRRGEDGSEQAAPEAVVEAAKAAKEKLEPIEEELIQKRTTGRGDGLKYPGKLNVLINSITAIVASADSTPTQQAYDAFREFSGRADEQLTLLRQVIDGDVARLNDVIRQSDAAPIDTSAASAPAAGS